jgi:hypothetical protein
MDSNFQFRADRETERSSAELPRSEAVLIEPHQRVCVGEQADLPNRVIAAAEPMRVLFAMSHKPSAVRLINGGAAQAT